MILADKSHEATLLAHPSEITALTSADLQSFLRLLSSTTFVVRSDAPGTRGRPGRPAQTSLSKQIGLLQAALFEWPAMAAKTLRLLLGARSGVQSAAWQGRWSTLRELTPASFTPRTLISMANSLNGEELLSVDDGPSAASRIVWESAINIATGAVLALGTYSAANMRDRLEAIAASPRMGQFKSLTAAAAWALAAFGDADALARLDRLIAEHRDDIDRQRATIIERARASLENERAAQTKGRSPVRSTAESSDQSSAKSDPAPQRNVEPETGPADHGLTSDGWRVWELGPYKVAVEIAEGSRVRSIVIAPGGARVTTIPKPIQAAHAETLKKIGAACKALDDDVSAQRARFEESMLTGSAFTLSDVTEFLGANPILAHIVRRLVWAIVDTSGDCIAFVIAGDRGAWHDVSGKSVRLDSTGQLRIAHPIELASDELAAWQRRLHERALVQPFKQVFRETYWPSAAELERRTVTRFESIEVASEVLRDVLSSRGWSAVADTTVSKSAGESRRRYGARGFVARLGFHSEGKGNVVILDDLAFSPSEDSNRTSARGRVAGAAVDPVVFSEAARDVGLLVASVETGKEAREAAIAAARVPIVRIVIGLSPYAARVAFEGSSAVVNGRFRIDLGNSHVFDVTNGRQAHVTVNTRNAAKIWIPFVEDEFDVASILALIASIGQFT